jgi:hypothetical protein
MLRLSLILVFVVFSSCRNNAYEGSLSDVNAFYFWQTSLNTFDWQDSTFKALNTKKIYYRFFDVDWSAESGNPVPVSPLEGSYSCRCETHAEVVPVVFIANETFANLSLDESKRLAKNVHRKVLRQLPGILMTKGRQDIIEQRWWQQDPYQVKSRKFDEQRRYDSLYQAKMKQLREVQFDCDWTASTRDKYFAFLEESKRLFKEQLITSTVRLYQFKYPKDAGVPPVSRGMLMVYNAGNVRDLNEVNSIFNKKQVMSYLKAGQYPLPLDYALPLFEWALIFREGQLLDIVSASDLAHYNNNFETSSANRFKVANDFVFGFTAKSILIRKGDEIRIESPDMDDVKETAAWLSEHRNNKDAILTLYHLNNHDIQKNSKEIEDIFNSF